jgi:hypothetical protein
MNDVRYGFLRRVQDCFTYFYSKPTHVLTPAATVVLVFGLMPNGISGRTVLFPLKILERSRMLSISAHLWSWNKTVDWD